MVPAGVRLLLGTLLALGASQVLPAAGQADRQTAGDITVYLQLVPSRIVDDDRHRKEAQKMHGGVPIWGNPYHVTATVFDASTGQRLEDVDVRASVVWRESKLVGEHKRLQPMLAEGGKSWGNFFSIPAVDPFRIRLDVQRQPKGPVVKMEFPYIQRPHFAPRAN